MTYADLHLLASQFVNEDEHSRDLRSPQALEYRLFLSKFLVRVKQREDEGLRQAKVLQFSSVKENDNDGIPTR